MCLHIGLCVLTDFTQLYQKGYINISAPISTVVLDKHINISSHAIAAKLKTHSSEP